MRSLLVVVLCALFALAACENHPFQGVALNSKVEPRIMEDQIRNILNCIQSILRDGDPELGLPPLDPLQQDEMDFVLDDPNIVTGKVNLKNIKIGGFAGWDITKLVGSITIIPIGARFELHLNWPLNEVVADYDIDLSAMGHTITGKGHLDLSLVNFKIEFGLHGVLRISVNDVRVYPSMESANLQLGELAFDGIDISGAVVEVFSNLHQWLAENADQINGQLSQILSDLINNILNGGGAYSMDGLFDKCQLKRRLF